MIREFRLEDKDHLQDLINSIDTGYEVDNVEEIHNNAKTIYVYAANQLRGFAYATFYDNEANEKVAELKLYVEPESRRHGIGTALHNELMGYIKSEKLDVLNAYVRVDIQDPAPFCEKLGFHKWWGSPELIYIGNSLPEVDLDFVQYEDQYYEQYGKIKQECYHEIQKSNDIKPYLVPLTEEDRTQNAKNKENIFLALDNDNIIASVTVGKETIDNLMVAPSYQGKGYGKKALQYGMNKILSRGNDVIRICYMEGNESAENLYYSLGFKPLQNTHVYRRFVR
ncbi:GNAT family N-acetyltransferase [Alkalihalobacillus sp. AL-G]|uniref:GNAT family N-acetyltransferase n=1 Tax=Alkalihalobacillus sp. AL-G TaxID=2926399 RepID=UPI00272D0467|nr:GNAT family N-acetyltransferase [Alkalihalobacillus sp. AL-G]WLD92539.1 GNAT family N-acetyltransferase [Alkalihalobacillus sp. AL-G]